MTNRLISLALGAILTICVSATGEADEYTALAFSPDSAALVTGWSNGRKRHEVRFHRAADGQPLFGFRTRGKVEQLAFSADGGSLATLQTMRGTKKRIEIWDVESSTALNSTIVDSVSPFGHDQLALFGSVETAAVARTGKPSILWNYGAGKKKLQRTWTNSFARTTNDRIMAYGDGTSVQVRRIVDGKPISTLPSSSSSSPTGLAFGDGNKRIAVARGVNVEIWSARQGDRQRVLRAPDYVKGLAFQPWGVRVAIASWDNPILIYNARTGARLLRLRADDLDWYEDVAIANKGARVAGLTLLGRIRVWNSLSGKPLYSLP